jgi:hypothetical protein
LHRRIEGSLGKASRAGIHLRGDGDGTGLRVLDHLLRGGGVRGGGGGVAGTSLVLWERAATPGAARGLRRGGRGGAAWRREYTVSFRSGLRRPGRDGRASRKASATDPELSATASPRPHPPGSRSPGGFPPGTAPAGARRSCGLRHDRRSRSAPAVRAGEEAHVLHHPSTGTSTFRTWPRP